MNYLKKIKRGVFLPLFILIALFSGLFFGCDNIFSPLKGTESYSIPDGYGRVVINVTGGEARTIFPVKIFDHFVYTFTKAGGSGLPQDLVPENGSFTLETGTWTMEVKAYVGGIDNANLAAIGGPETFELVSGKTVPVTVNLKPNMADGEGIFSYVIKYPAGTEAQITLINLPNFDNEEKLEPGAPVPGGEGYEIISQTLSLEAGFYLLTVKITKGGLYQGISEVVHIYDLLTSEYGNAENPVVFTDDFLKTTVNKSVSAIEGISLPVMGEIPVSGSITSTAQYTGTVTWNIDNDGMFEDYIAAISLEAVNGYTFTGVPADFFTVAGATTVNSGTGLGSAMVVNAVFKKVTVSFDSQGGSATAPVHTFHGNKIVKPVDPESAAEEKFAGWFMNADCNAPGAVLERWRFAQMPVTGSLTLYARWLPGTYMEMSQEDLLEIFDKDNWEEVTVYFNGEPIVRYSNPEFDLEGEYFLTEDIDLDKYDGPDGKGWVPIGFSTGEDDDYDNPFRGIFDGNGCVISYLHSGRESDRFVGLFGAIRDSEIRNIGVHVTGIIGLNDVGGITGNAKSSLIENCYVKGNITARSSVGAISSHIGEGTIVRNCYSADGLVTSLEGDAGGIVGNILDGGTIVNCYSSITLNAAREAGGIVAWVRDRGVPVVSGPYENQNFPTVIKNNVAINPVIQCDPEYFFYSDWLSSCLGNIVGNRNLGKPYPAERPITIQDNIAWDGIVGKNRAGAIVPFDASDRNGTPKSLSTLKMQSTYEGLGWKFGNNDENPWKMPAGGGYPILYWE